MNPKQKSMIIGVVLGGVLGALGGYLFTRGLDLPHDEEEAMGLSLRSVPPGEMVRLFISIMGVLRGVAELGERVLDPGDPGADPLRAGQRLGEALERWCADGLLRGFASSLAASRR